ncbi:MAG: hypothetical protein AAFV25_24670 [Bacteroidota bacterium]
MTQKSRRLFPISLPPKPFYRIFAIDMKNGFSFLLASLVFFAMAKDVLLWAAFKINQADIIQKYCVNQKAPERMCRGKCFLKTNIEQSKDHSSQDNAPLQVLEEPSKVHYLGLEALPPKPFDWMTQRAVPCTYPSLISRLITLDLLRPPRL